MQRHALAVAIAVNGAIPGVRAADGPARSGPAQLPPLPWLVEART
jgi:hypothetical protein